MDLTMTLEAMLNRINDCKGVVKAEVLAG